MSISHLLLFGSFCLFFLLGLLVSIGLGLGLLLGNGLLLSLGECFFLSLLLCRLISIFLLLLLLGFLRQLFVCLCFLVGDLGKQLGIVGFKGLSFHIRLNLGEISDGVFCLCLGLVSLLGQSLELVLSLLKLLLDLHTHVNVLISLDLGLLFWRSLNRFSWL